MTLPDKPIVIDLDQIGLDDWIAFADVSAQLEGLRGARDMAAMGEALRGARQLLATFLVPGGWTLADVGAVNLGEMKQLIGQIGAGIRGPNDMSGSPSTPPTNTGESSRSKRASARPHTNGAVRRGTSRPSSA